MPQQAWLNNWSTRISSVIDAQQTRILIPNTLEDHPGDRIEALMAQGRFVDLTLDGGTAQEIVRVIGAGPGYLDVERGREGTVPQYWNAGTLLELRITAAALDSLREADRILTAGGDVLVGADGNVLTQ